MTKEGSAPDVARKTRRFLDPSSLVALLPVLAFLPVSALCAYPFALVLSIILPVEPALLVLGWMLLAWLAFVRPVEKVLIRLVFRARRPTSEELATIEPPWRRVCSHAGVDPSKYVLAVEESAALNAFAAAGHIVAVTRGAIELSEPELEGILAHELGHQLGLHPVTLTLSLWYGPPIALLARLSPLVERLGLLLVRGGFWATRESSHSLPGADILVEVAAMLARILAFAVSLTIRLIAWALRAVLWISTAMGSAIGRHSEFYADAAATRLGYGPVLLGLFRRFSTEGDDDEGGDPTLTERIFNSHPPIAERFRRVDAQVRGEPVGPLAGNGSLIALGVLGVALLAFMASLTVSVLSGGGGPEQGHGQVPPGVPCPENNAARRITFPGPPPVCIDRSKSYRALMETDVGTVEIALDDDKAPITVNNFVFLARYHYYDGVPFHRVIPGFVIQGGDGQKGDGTGGPGYTIPDENPKVGQYEIGSLAMANTGQPDSGGSQFFVITGPEGMKLPLQYSLFGRVTERLDILQRIEVDGSPTGAPTAVHSAITVRITES